MRWLLLSIVWLWAQTRPDLVVLVETSHLTCGQPVELARSALAALCGQEQGAVAIGTFSRIRGGRTISWLTTPTVPLAEIGTCQTLVRNIRSVCDSIHTVHLLSAIEEAIQRYEGVPVLVFASGRQTGNKPSLQEIRRLAENQGSTLYIVSVGWLTNNTEVQGSLKELVGVYEGKKQYFLADPSRPSESLGPLRAFVLRVWQEALQNGVSEASPKEGKAAVQKEDSVTPEPAKSTAQEEIPIWVWFVGGAVLLLGALWLFSGGKKTQAAQTTADAAPASVPTSAPPPPPAPPALTLSRFVVFYPHTQQEVRLSPSTAPITIGRAPDNTLVIQDPTVSSRHARLFLQGSQWYVQDLGSTNGTFVNEQRITQYPIRTGDKIRLGAIIVQVVG
ncbi:MAG: hypothetical protein KatS3mg025_0589 [Bacteroidia bacterium]|nr:MAG: hypothetical protein KatS3mg025_0589 [Bacteroidia bacterium]